MAASEDDDRSTAVTVVLGALIALAAVLGLTVIIGDDGGSLVEDVAPPEVPMAALAAEWLDAWTVGDAERMTELGGDAVLAGAFTDALQVTELDAVAGIPDPARGAVPFTATATLAGLGRWTWTGELAMAEVEDEDGDDVWALSWSPSALHPSLTEGRRVARTRAWPERAPLLAVDGAPLASPSLSVPVVGGRMTLGTWQSIALLDPNRDNPSRTVRLAFLTG